MKQDLYAARGAVFLREDTPAEVDRVVRLLLSALAEANGTAPEDCLSLTFSSTSDLRSRNPATAARAAGWDVALFSLREAEFEGSPPRVIRALLLFRGPPGLRVRPVYLEGAEALRPDLSADILTGQTQP